MSTEDFIKLVEQYPCIYNSDLPDYARKETTEKAWDEVSDQIGWSVTECKEKWKNIRNGFVRSLKPALNGVSKKPYYLCDAMQFVVPYINPTINIQKNNRRAPSPNEEQSEDEPVTVKEETIEIEHDPLEPPFTRRPRRSLRRHRLPEERINKHLQNKRTRLDDPREMFLLSLLPDVKSLTDKQLSVFRIKVLMLLEAIKSRSGSELMEYFER